MPVLRRIRRVRREHFRQHLVFSVLAQTANCTIYAEGLSAAAQDASEPFAWEAGQRIDGALVGLEFRVAAILDSILRDEWIAHGSQDSSGSTEFDSLQVGDGIQTTEWGSSARSDRLIQSEQLSGGSSNLPPLLEGLGGAISHPLVPLEWIEGAQSDRSGLSEWSARGSSDGTTPTEWLGITAVTSDGIVRLEWIVGGVSDRFPWIEWLANATLDGATPAEWTKRLSADPPAGQEWLGKPISDGALPSEWRATILSDSFDPLEWLFVGGVTNGYAQLELVSGAQFDGTAAAEILARSATDFTAVEWLAKGIADFVRIEWLARSNADFTLVEWVGHQQSDTYPLLVELLFKQELDAAGRVEVIGSQQSDEALGQVEFAVGERRDLAVVWEFLSGQQWDGGLLLIEIVPTHVSPVDGVIQIEWLGRSGIDSNALIEAISGKSADYNTRSEWISANRRDALAPIEYQLGRIYDAFLPIEAVRVCVLDSILPQEWRSQSGPPPTGRAILRRVRPTPLGLYFRPRVYFTVVGTAGETDGSLPFEWTMYQRGDSQAALEAIAHQVGDRGPSSEWVAGRRLDALLPDENLARASIDRILPGEFVGRSSQDSLVRGEWLFTEVVNALGQIETTASRQVIDGILPVDWTTSAISEVRDAILPLEWLLSAYFRANVPTETLTAALLQVSDRFTPVEWISALALGRPARLELVVADVLDGAVLAEWVENSVGNTFPVLFDWGSMSRRGAATLIESIALRQASRTAPIEIPSSSRIDFTRPLEWLEVLRSSVGPSQFEWSIKVLSADRSMPIEVLPGQSADANALIEVFATIYVEQSDGALPLEWVNAALADAGLLSEWLATTIQARQIDGLLPIDWVSARIIDATAPLELRAFFRRMQRDGEFGRFLSRRRIRILPRW